VKIDSKGDYEKHRIGGGGQRLEVKPVLKSLLRAWGEVLRPRERLVCQSKIESVNETVWNQQDRRFKLNNLQGEKVGKRKRGNGRIFEETGWTFG